MLVKRYIPLLALVPAITGPVSCVNLRPATTQDILTHETRPDEGEPLVEDSTDSMMNQQGVATVGVQDVTGLSLTRYNMLPGSVALLLGVTLLLSHRREMVRLRRNNHTK